MSVRPYVRCWFCLMTAATSERVAAQPFWEPAGVPFLTEQMYSIYTDTITSAMYFCGLSSISNNMQDQDEGISVYYHGQWDTLGVFNGEPQDIVRWHDTLFLCGNFYEINGEPIVNCAYYDSSTWHQCGDFPISPRSLKVLDGELFALGAFDYADGHECRGIARRQGTEWVSVGVAGFADFDNYIHDVDKFEGDLVITGGVHFEGTTAKGIGVQENGVWHGMGAGIPGGFSQGGSLAIYQGELYVSGAIHMSEGNPGEGIMKWTGSEFVPLGTGLQNQNNQWATNVGAYDMKVHNGLLYVSGVFWFAGHVPAVGIATWDGTNWCGLGGEPDLPMFQFNFLGDTLFAAPFLNYEGEYVNSGLRYIGTYPDTCTNITTAVVPATTWAALTVRSDASGVHVVLPTARAVQLVDAMGRIVGGKTAAEVTFQDLAPGPYMVLAEGYKPQRVVVQ